MNAQHGRSIRKKEAKLSLDNISNLVEFLTAKENGKILSFYCDDAESAAEVQNWPGIGIYLLPIPEVVLYREYGKLLEAIKPFC